METIGLRKLRHQLTPTLDRVEAGCTLVITDHRFKRAVLLPLDLYEDLMAAKAVADGAGQGGT